MYQLTRGFSRQHRIMDFTTTVTHHLSHIQTTDLPIVSATGLHQDNHRLAPLPSCVTPSLAYYQPRSCASPHPAPEGTPGGSGQLVQLIQHGRGYTGTGISTRCPSTTPVGLALGPDSPWEDWPGPGTLGLSAGKVLTCLIATHACILTPTPSTPRSHGRFHGCRTLPYPPTHLAHNP